MSALNKVKFQQFLRQARGADVNEIHVNRLDKRSSVVLRYNGKAPRKKVRLTGEWAIARGEGDDAAIHASIQEFLSMARKHFFVHRGEGLDDASFADEAMEAEAKPIVKEEAAD